MPSSLDALNQRGTDCLPGHLDIRFLESSPGKQYAEL